MPFFDIFSKEKEKKAKQEEKIKITADYREKNSLVVPELINLNAEVEFQNLPVADYIMGNIAVERKTISDFISSMINKRLPKQLEEIMQFEKKFLIIEGYEEKDIYKRRVHENAIRGMILSVILNFGVPIIFTKNEEDTAKYLIVLAKRLEKNDQETGLRAKKKVFNVKERQQMIIEGFPGVGPSIAKELLRKFGSIKSVINAEFEELKEIKKMNEKKAKIIKELVEREYH